MITFEQAVQALASGIELFYHNQTDDDCARIKPSALGLYHQLVNLKGGVNRPNANNHRWALACESGHVVCLHDLFTERRDVMLPIIESKEIKLAQLKREFNLP